MFEIKFKITDLSCGACVKLSEDALSGIAGVTQADVDLNSGLAEIRATRDIGWEEILAALQVIDKQATTLN